MYKLFLCECVSDIDLFFFQDLTHFKLLKRRFAYDLFSDLLF